MALILPFAIAFAKTDVYFKNNTNFSIDFDQVVTSNNLSTKAFKQNKRVVLPSKEVKLLSFDRRSRIKKNRIFDLKTEGSINELDLSFSLYQRLRGTAVHSDMWQGVSPESLTQSRKWKREILQNGDRFFQLSFCAHYTGGDDDIYYVLDEVTESFKRVDSSKLKILAYNTYMRPTALFKNGQSIRANLMYQKLRGYDVVILSELFADSVRKHLLKKLKRYYPYQSDVVEGSGIFSQDGGVVIVSRWPIVKEDKILFNNLCERTFDDCLSEKGAKYVRIVKGTRYFSIIGTHTQSQPDRASRRVRTKQLNLIRNYIERNLLDQGDLIFVGGDLNVDRYDVADYDSMLDVLDALEPEYQGEEYTYNSKKNKLVGSSAMEYLDYIFPIESSIVPTISINRAFALKSDRFWREYIWEPFFKDLSDHYPVEGYFQL